MSLGQVAGRDITAYVQSVLQNSDDPPNDTGSATGLGTIAGAGDGRSCVKYHQGRDRYYCIFRVSSAFQAIHGLGFIDPFLVAASPPQANYLNGITLGGGAAGTGRLAVDQFDATSGAQRVFTTDGGNVSVEIDPVTLHIVADPAFTGPNGDFDELVGSVSGYSWNALDEHATYWTGLTDGLPLETLDEGTNVYPDGLFLIHVQAGEINGQSFSNRLAWIDLRTRRCVGILGGTNVPAGDFSPLAFPAEVSSSPTGLAGEEPIGGDSFDWLCTQYVADVDATFARPKGRLLFHCREEIPSIISPSGGEQLRVYVRLTDFNPFGVAAGVNAPARTHGRVRLTSRILADVAPMFNVAGQDFQSNPGQPSVNFDPLRNRFVMVLSEDSQINTDASVRFCTFGAFSSQPDVATVTNPAARDVPRTNDVVRFDVLASGDLGERIAGVDITWTLTRRSTEGEALDASTFPGTSTVANPPIDEDDGGAAVLTVVSDGVALTEGVDYSVVTSTGVITWITDQSGAALVTATYEHRETAATPAHGTLLTPASQTDPNGVAAARVAYPDDDPLVGTLDHLDASEA